MSEFPRKIVLSADFGSSFFENLNTNLVVSKVDPYDVIESEALVQACEEGLRWADAKQKLIESGFPARYIEPVDHWGWERGSEVLVKVVEVNGPYIVEDYDGAEYVLEKNALIWRD